MELPSTAILPTRQLMPRALSLAVVGADYPNPGKMPGCRFEIALCQPGDPIDLVPEPKNKHDGNAIMVMSERGVCLGYVSAERTSIIHYALRDGRAVQTIFQAKADFGAWVRVAFDEPPSLPLLKVIDADGAAYPDDGFYPDYIPPDD